MSWPSTYPIQPSRLISAFRGDFNDIIDELLSGFLGGTEPSITYPGMLWQDTASGLWKRRNTADTGWITLGSLETDYLGLLPKSGGTMTGAIDMNGQAITGLPAGSGTAPARYSDLAAYAKLDGSTPFTDFPDLPATNPTVSTEAAHKGYVDGKVAAGGTYNGQIVMTVAPTADQHVMRKQDVTNLIDTHNHNGISGNGPKIAETSIASPSGSSGKILTANGSLGASFEDLAAPLTLLPGSVYIGSLGSVASWSAVDLSAVIPADAVAVYLRIVSTAYSTWTVKFRTYGGAGSGFAAYAGSQILVPCSAQKIEKYSVRSAGSEACYLYVDGYVGPT